MCLHPLCPLDPGGTWEQAVGDPRVDASQAEQAALIGSLGEVETLGEAVVLSDDVSRAVRRRLLNATPCLFAQVNELVTPAGVVHLCEATLGVPLSSTNIETAFRIQDPGDAGITFLHAPLVPAGHGGSIMEQLCSRLLHNEGIPAMMLGPDGWPTWTSPGHVSLNAGKFSALKMYGDILMPAAPHNVLISVKSVKARERFLVSGNRLESVGFGFFDDPSEFWTTSRMKLYKRWGFVAIYMPQNTLTHITAHLAAKDTGNHAININGRPLYRPLGLFTADMLAIAGRLSLDL